MHAPAITIPSCDLRAIVCQIDKQGNPLYYLQDGELVA